MTLIFSKIWTQNSFFKFLLPGSIAFTSVPLYIFIGTPQSETLKIVSSSDESRLAELIFNAEESIFKQPTDEKIIELTISLENRLKKDKDDLNGWLLLAKASSKIGSYDKAIIALENASRLLPNEPDLIADLADAVGRSQEGDLNGRPMDLLKKSININPNHGKSLALLATAYMNNEENELAIFYWTKVVDGLPKESKQSELVGEIIAKLSRELLPKKNVKKIENMIIKGKILFDEEVLNLISIKKLDEKAAVFIIIKDPENPERPLAVKKILFSSIQNQIERNKSFFFVINEENLMLSQSNITKLKKLVIFARLSLEGITKKKYGDFFSDPLALIKKNNNVFLTIDNQYREKAL